MRTAEYALLLVPILLLLGWLWGIRGLSRNGMVAALLFLAAYAGLLVWLGEERSFIGPYVPARLHGGELVPGHPK